MAAIRRQIRRKVVRNEVFRQLSRPNIATRRVDSSAGTVSALLDEQEADRQWEREWADHHLRLVMKHLRGTSMIAGRVLNCDGVVDAADLALLLGSWGPRP